MKKSLCLAAVLCGLFPAAAMAHVTANPNTGEAGRYFKTEFRVSHGCNGSATTSVSIKLPKGTVVLKPQAKHGWTVQTRKSKLAEPVSVGHGKMTDEQFDEVIWSGGHLPDDQYDEFGVLLKLPADAQTLWFPVTQICENGQHEWVEIPSEGQKWHEVKSPAPFVTVTAPEEPGHAGHKH